MASDDRLGDAPQLACRHAIALDQPDVRRHFAELESCVACPDCVDMRRRMVVRVHDDPDMPQKEQRCQDNLSDRLMQADVKALHRRNAPRLRGLGPRRVSIVQDEIQSPSAIGRHLGAWGQSRNNSVARTWGGPALGDTEILRL